VAACGLDHSLGNCTRVTFVKAVPAEEEAAPEVCAQLMMHAVCSTDADLGKEPVITVNLDQFLQDSGGGRAVCPGVKWREHLSATSDLNGQRHQPLILSFPHEECQWSGQPLAPLLAVKLDHCAPPLLILQMSLGFLGAFDQSSLAPTIGIAGVWPHES
jgi:hypothetical protein